MAPVAPALERVLREAQGMVRSGDARGALELLRGALPEHRGSVDMHMNLAIAQRALGDYPAAIEALDAALAQIRKGAPDAIAETKALIRRARLEDPASLVDEAAAIFANAARGPEGAEGMTAFLEKRPAKWVG